MIKKGFGPHGGQIMFFVFKLDKNINIEFLIKNIMREKFNH